MRPIRHACSWIPLRSRSRPRPSFPSCLQQPHVCSSEVVSSWQEFQKCAYIKDQKVRGGRVERDEEKRGGGGRERRVGGGGSRVIKDQRQDADPLTHPPSNPSSPLPPTTHRSCTTPERSTRSERCPNTRRFSSPTPTAPRCLCGTWSTSQTGAAERCGRGGRSFGGGEEGGVGRGGRRGKEGGGGNGGKEEGSHRACVPASSP
jgi:hypothetical protein